MSVVRSPNKGSTCNKMTLASGGSSSQPDLSKIDHTESELSHLLLRKRKAPDNDNDFAYQFSEFRKEILGILTASTRSNNENINTISQNISSIKDQLSDIKATTEHLVTENNNVKSQIMTLAETVKENEIKIESLQNDVQKLVSTESTSAPSQAPPPLLCDEDLIFELQERTERSKNVVMTGLSEPQADTVEDRIETDRKEAQKIIEAIIPSVPINRVQRLGKYDSKKSRPLKICFASQDAAKSLLRNKNNIKVEGLRIFSDQTPYQQKFMEKLRKELKQRQDNGETDIKIKYVKGTPKIIKEQLKN